MKAVNYILLLLFVTGARSSSKDHTKIYTTTFGPFPNFKRLTPLSELLFSRETPLSELSGVSDKTSSHASVPPEDKCARICPKTFEVVCASNGEVYFNMCLLSVSQCRDSTIKFVKFGRCHKDECDKPCNRMFNPVCASDGNSYDNKCLLEIAQCRDKSVEFVRKGRCDEVESEDKEKHDLTPTQLFTEAATTTYKTRTREECMKACTREFSPICGSDNHTYANPCDFEIGQCSNPSLKKVGEYECERPNGGDAFNFIANIPNAEIFYKCPPVCGSEPLLEVCGSDGKTYETQCKLREERCRSNPDLEELHYGACEDK